MGAMLEQRTPVGPSLRDRISAELDRAGDVGEACDVLARAIRSDLGRGVFVALSEPDAAGRLRVVWEVRGGPGVQHERSSLRRAVLGSQRPTRVRSDDGSGRALAVFPVSCPQRPIGVLEVGAPEASIDAAWDTLEAAGDLLGRHLEGLGRGDDTGRRHDPLPPSRGAVRRSVDAGSRRGVVHVPPRVKMSDEQLDWGIAVMAHEIRGPLLGVRAVLEIVLQRPDADPVDVDILQRSVAELNRLAVTAEGLLAWAAGARSLQPRSGDVVQVVEEAVASCRLEAGEDRVVVFAPPSVPARFDPPQLRSAVANLLRNALAYANPGTKVEVSVREQGDVVVLSVKDEGPEIPPADRERIFDPFVRGDREGRIGNRAGLGLFITRRVIEDHGGRVWVESGRGGTTFHIVLPMGGRRGQRCAS